MIHIQTVQQHPTYIGEAGRFLAGRQLLAINVQPGHAPRAARRLLVGLGVSVRVSGTTTLRGGARHANSDGGPSHRLFALLRRAQATLLLLLLLRASGILQAWRAGAGRGARAHTCAHEQRHGCLLSHRSVWRHRRQLTLTMGAWMLSLASISAFLRMFARRRAS